MAKTKLNREEQLKKKREAERERRRKIRENPDLREIEKQKEHARYLKKKQLKKVKSIDDMTEREKRMQRKKWKVSQKKCRERKKEEERQMQLLRENTPPSSDEEHAGPLNERIENQNLPGNNEKDKYEKMKARNRKKRSRAKFECLKRIKNLEIQLERYKKRYRRLKKRVEKSKTPDILERRVEEIIEAGPSSVKENLILGEVLKKQLERNYSLLKTTEEKYNFTTFVGNKILKKYKLLHKCAKFTNFKQLSRVGPGVYYSRKGRSNIALKNKIIEFLEEDENSRMCAGKKEYMRKRSTVKQKRFLNFSLKSLHEKFLRKYPEHQVSYSMFCRTCPFWIKLMNIKDRQTCKCVIHANMEFIVKALFTEGIIGEKNIDEILNTVCCSKYSSLCLLRKCGNCNEKEINILSVSGNDISCFKWISRREKFICSKTKKKKIISKTLKENVNMKATDLVQEFKLSFQNFLQHQGRAVHQHETIKKLKEELNSNEILIHMDFSENYSIKYGEEIQSFHFGGSRRQITLHTVVTYMKVGNTLNTDCFCTISNSLAHDVPAIWAHLLPILNDLPENIEILHFLSDSPATQYRNKTMFYFLAKHLKTFYPQLTRFTWSYTESGHGKGAPDGIGGTCKRIADREISFGNDITNIDSLSKVLKERCTGIKILVIEESELENMKTRITSQPLPFKGTMNVHQVASDTGNFSKLYMRALSCFECLSECSHYGLGELDFSAYETDDEDSDIFPHDVGNKSQINYSDVYSSSSALSSPAPFLNSVALSTEKNVFVEKGDFILCEFPGRKGKKYRYVSKCLTDVDERGELQVISLKSENSINMEFSVIENDESYIKLNQISVLKSPKEWQMEGKILYKFENPIDIFEL